MTRTETLLALVLLAAVAAPARAQEPREKAALCVACHGAAGVPINPETPVIWGQNAGYIYIQLRDFKAGHRRNPQMSPIAESLDKQEMKDLAMYFADQPWPNLQQPLPPRDDIARADSVTGQAACKSCHLDDWHGDSGTPRLAGQSGTYLNATMQAFRNGSRANNPSMAALLSSYSDRDIAAMARFLASQ